MAILLELDSENNEVRINGNLVVGGAVVNNNPIVTRLTDKSGCVKLDDGTLICWGIIESGQEIINFPEPFETTDYVVALVGTTITANMNVQLRFISNGTNYTSYHSLFSASYTRKYIAIGR